MRKLVLWGHNINDFRLMFDLSQEEIDSSILEYGCGPNAINALQHEGAHDVVSCDPLYVLDKETLASKTKMIFASMAEEMAKEKDLFDFKAIGGLPVLVAQRQQGLNTFFTDYELGKQEGRYLGISDYHLPFDDFSFDFALVAHYLFAELDEQSVEFHVEIIKELARVAKEVRIFPLIDRQGQTSPLLGPVLLSLQEDNFGVEVREVDYHLFKSGNAMLRVWANQCAV